jgi:hypothetical protein
MADFSLFSIVPQAFQIHILDISPLICSLIWEGQGSKHTIDHIPTTDSSVLFWWTWISPLGALWWMKHWYKPLSLIWTLWSCRVQLSWLKLVRPIYLEATLSNLSLPKYSSYRTNVSWSCQNTTSSLRLRFFEFTNWHGRTAVSLK